MRTPKELGGGQRSGSGFELLRGLTVGKSFVCTIGFGGFLFGIYIFKLCRLTVSFSPLSWSCIIFTYPTQVKAFGHTKYPPSSSLLCSNGSPQTYVLELIIIVYWHLLLCYISDNSSADKMHA